MHKGSVKKKKKKKKKKTHQRKGIQKLRKGEQYFLYATQHLNLIHIAIVSSRYSIMLPTYGMHKVNLKFHQREVSQKLRKGEQSFFVRDTSF